MRETNTSAFMQLQHEPTYRRKRNQRILDAWVKEGYTWVEIAERTGIPLRSVQRYACEANGGSWPKEGYKRD